MRAALVATLFSVMISAPVFGAESFRFIAFGDMPYGKSADDGRFDRLVDEINKVGGEFVIHIGDTKSGASKCSDERFQKILDQIQRIEQPLIYTPGDNEWTDCHRLTAGGYDPVERLGKLRRMFFSEGRSLGQNPMPLEQQLDDSHPYIENATWIRDGVRFATLHMVGSDNNFRPGNPEAMREFNARSAGNEAWLAHVKRRAEDEDAKALVLAFHGDFLKGGNDSSESELEAGFIDFVEGMIDLAEDFRNPILLIHGDWHEYKYDQPLRDHHGNILDNVWRLEVPGAKDIRAVEVTVTPGAREPFSVRPFPE